MSVEQANSQILEQPLEHLLVPYVNYLTFGIDVAAGIIIAISAFIGLISFFKILFKPAKEQTIDKETIDFA
jgi:hypothetical protein